MIDMKPLTPAEMKHIYDLVSNLLNIINYDDTGVTDELIEEAEIVAEILGIKNGR
jgi:hypothetical protein